MNPATQINTTGAAGFLDWLRVKWPRMYQEVKHKIPKGMSGFGETTSTTAASTTGTSPTWMQTVQNIVTAAGQAWLTKEQVEAQQKILKMQLDRAANGLAPLDIDPRDYGIGGPSVSVGFAPGTQKMLIYGGLGLAALLFLPRLLGSRR